jgi:hypothetical protein
MTTPETAPCAPTYSDRTEPVEALHDKVNDIIDLLLDEHIGAVTQIGEMRARAKAAEARLAAAEAEVARLTAALAEAEERAAGPFYATCDGLDDAEYGRRLEDVLDRLYERLGESLEEEYEPVEWAAVVAGWEMTVGHGVELVPVLDDDGEPRMDLRAAAGWWYYDLRLTVTPDGQPVLTAERRAGGAR